MICLAKSRKADQEIYGLDLNRLERSIETEMMEILNGRLKKTKTTLKVASVITWMSCSERYDVYIDLERLKIECLVILPSVLNAMSAAG